MMKGARSSFFFVGLAFCVIVFWWSFLNGLNIDGFLNIAIIKTRLGVKGVFDSLFGEPYSTLICGMIFGISGSLPRELKSSLTRTGVIHVVVVSGYNITLLAGFLWGILKPVFSLSFLNILKILILELFLLFYVLISGAGIPSIRAFIMFNLYILGRAVGRPRSGIVSVIFTGLLFVVYDRSMIENISFQFSFLATLGLIMYQRTFFRAVRYLLPKIRLPLIGSAVTTLLESFSSTLAATFLLWPVISYHFGYASLISPLANVLVLWAIPFLMVGGSIALVLHTASPVLARLAAVPLLFLLKYFVWVVSFLGDLGFSGLSIRVGKNFLAVYFLICFLMTFFLRKKGVGAY